MNSEPVDDIADATGLKSGSGPARLLKALGYSVSGFAAAWRHEAAFRQLASLGAVLFVAAFFVTDVPLERAILIAPILLSLAIELINSAIEATVDRISLELHPLSKRAKDLGSAAQLMALLSIALVWLLVLCG
ncbi:diacylglycerol kinase [Pseudomonas stutzeri]|uniref:Diacylglycerol kinase n=1 Tax=Stutzerimonas stutzeri KOS6 TaxID=1218352 RepID=A0A061JWA8_STUST|nr:diacylglycerol kinase [Stutzerimonas stutzeri]EWC43333.1 diacylglycerol kinase [Stutzerimonas stutzeri KOS6]MBK3869090.1 diacylglycerol kinase [Stutzerimonas stutzeri]